MKRVVLTQKLGWRFALLLTAATLAVVLPARQSEAAGLLVADGGLGGVLEIKEHQVNVTINNGVAVTEVEQVFVNTENRIVEALYTFPVPKAASVSNFSMWIGGKEMIGEVVEKERARQIYESYKQTRRDPGLLEQVDYKRFEMRIFPIAPGAEQRVRVTYYQELDFDHDWATYVYPLATVAKGGIDQTTKGKFALSLDVKNEVPLAEMKSPSHGDDFVIAQHSEGYWQASLETDGGDLSRDLVIAYRQERPRTGVDIIASKQSGEDGYFMLTLTPGKELEEKQTGADYVFVVDVSGSMANDSKLRLSRNSVAAFVDSLGPEDQFEVITFNVAVDPLFNAITKVDTQSQAKAKEFLDAQRARGGTVLRPAIEAAYRYRSDDRPLNVVVLSDGMTEQREQRELLELIGRRPAGTSVFCVGVGNEVNRPLLSQLAQDAGGLAAFVSLGDDFERQAEAFRRKLTRPAATNVKINFGSDNVYDVEPKKLPNLYHGQPIRLYGRYRNGQPTQVSIEAEVQGQPLSQTTEVSLPVEDSSNPQIERMWAFHKVQRLMDEARSSGDRNSTRDEIVRLCEGYSITSEHASFIVLENDGEYQRWKIDRRNATRVQRDRQAQQVVRNQLDQLRRQALQQVGPTRDGVKGEEVALGPQPNLDVAPPVQDQPSNSGGWDINVSGSNNGGSGGGGGGAIDPITALITAALAAAGLKRGRRKPQQV